MFERHDQPVISLRRFVVRLIKALVIVGVIDSVAVSMGAFGYREFARLDWLSAWQDAAMIITGNGLVVPIRTAPGKIFSMFDALIGVLVFITSAGVVLSPILHRILHVLHLQAREGTG